ncbi:MAG: hypothetical protein FWD57_01320 [Polyangiaceae bacterium]|nr:hypothetical protein [Polyangiaceae bacterium]
MDIGSSLEGFASDRNVGMPNPARARLALWVKNCELCRNCELRFELVCYVSAAHPFINDIE